jgi:hypothetical protein
MLWAIGLEKVRKRLDRRQRLVISAGLIIVVFGFVTGEIIKTTMAANYWHQYDDEFNWIKKNTPKDALFYTRKVDCMYYFIDRPIAKTFDDVLENGGYLMIRQEKEGDCPCWLPAIDPNEHRDILTQVYYNNFTKTEIYHVKSV